MAILFFRNSNKSNKKEVGSYELVAYFRRGTQSFLNSQSVTQTQAVFYVNRSI